jgi:hypothetical protein
MVVLEMLPLAVHRAVSLSVEPGAGAREAMFSVYVQLGVISERI